MSLLKIPISCSILVPLVTVSAHSTVAWGQRNVCTDTHTVTRTYNALCIDKVGAELSAVIKMLICTDVCRSAVWIL